MRRSSAGRPEVQRADLCTVVEHGLCRRAMALHMSLHSRAKLEPMVNIRALASRAYSAFHPAPVSQGCCRLLRTPLALAPAPSLASGRSNRAVATLAEVAVPRAHDSTSRATLWRSKTGAALHLAPAAPGKPRRQARQMWRRRHL